MRRVLAISLMMLFSFALITPLFASDALEASLPACCRRAGKHHCDMLEPGRHKGSSIGMVAEKCPCFPAATAAFHLSAFAPSTSDAIFAGLIHHPALHAQTAARYRISFDRSRQKRGPPEFLLL